MHAPWTVPVYFACSVPITLLRLSRVLASYHIEPLSACLEVGVLELGVPECGVLQFGPSGVCRSEFSSSQFRSLEFWSLQFWSLELRILLRRCCWSFADRVILRLPPRWSISIQCNFLACYAVFVLPLSLLLCISQLHCNQGNWRHTRAACSLEWRDYAPRP